MASDNGNFHDVLLAVNEKKIHFVRFLLSPKNKYTRYYLPVTYRVGPNPEIP